MLRLSTSFARSNPLYNSTFGLGTKARCLQRRLSIPLNGIINRQLHYKIVNNNKSTKVTQICNNYNYNNSCVHRRIHISSSSNCSSHFNDESSLKSSKERKTYGNIKSLLDNPDYSIKEDRLNKEAVESDGNFENDESSSRQHHHHRKFEKYTIKDIERMYPNPKSKLHEIFQLVDNDRKLGALNISFKQPVSQKYSPVAAADWTCTVRILWPEEVSFSAHAHTKIRSGFQASLKCLLWLENQKKLRNGMPVLYDTQGIKSMMQAPVRLSISGEALDQVQVIIDKYNESIKSLIENNQGTSYEQFDNRTFRTGAVIDPVGNSNPANRISRKIGERNNILQKRYESRESSYNSELPIYKFRDQIIKAVETNQVLLIKGDTGCGKTTQVPQFIMDSFAKEGIATQCNMIISQPRRISAISLAERVAEERSEQVGDVVGFQVRLSQNFPNTPAGILFCTTGMLLRKLQFNPLLEGCSHVIVDEAHERTIDTDMLLVLLKRAMEKNQNLKVIIMSATINAELFQKYFQCSVIEVPGRLFPVEVNFLDDIDKIGLRAPSRYDLSFEEPEKTMNGPTVDIVKMGELISHICKTKPPGAILCFLPGWLEIMLMKKYLDQFAMIPHDQILILPLHSKIAHYEQKKIFVRPPPGVRKIVLATDIAETGITVTDVVYVVDSCIHKQIRWQEKRGISSIDNYWVSQANLQQRRGRAGRVKAGVSYHFIDKQRFGQLEAYPLPEVKRSALDKTVLDAKTYSSEKALKFLGDMPQPPAPYVISQAVNYLIDLGALDDKEDLTSLGKRISLFTVHPNLSKALVYSAIFQCVSSMVSIATVMSSDNEIFTKVLYNKGIMRTVKTTYHPSSDHVSLAWLYQQWRSIARDSPEQTKYFCLKNHLYPERMNTVFKVRDMYAEHLRLTHMMDNAETLDDMNTKENIYAELDEMVKGVLLSGVDHILYHRDFDIRKGVVKKGVSTLTMEDGNRATLMPDSVNFKRNAWPSPYLTYVRKTHSEERRTSIIRDSSIISPLTVFLFTQARVLGYLDQSKNNTTDTTDTTEQSILFTLKDRKNVNLICDQDTADALVKFRDIMWNIVRYMVDNYGIVQHDHMETFNQIDAYRVEMLQVLAKMLAEAARDIDRAETPKAK